MIVKFAPLVLIGVSVFIVFLVSPLFKKIKTVSHVKLARALLVYGLIVSLLWVIIANVLPMADSACIVKAAEYLNGDLNPEAVSQWSQGGYLHRYPYQTPLVLFFLLCIRIAGANSVLLFELFNCITCAISMFLIVKYTYQISKNNSAAILSGIIVALFFPLVLYCTFIYGDIISIPFVLACLYMQSVALSSRTLKIRYVVWSIIFGTVAALIKPSMFIVVIAVSIVYLFRFIKKKEALFIFFAIILILVAKFAILPINSFLESKTKANLGDGIGTVAWITMGLGGGREYIADNGRAEESTSLVLPGYYDEFLLAIPSGEYSSQKMASLSHEYLTKRLSHFRNDPGFAISFFYEKFVTEWTNPLFESLLASNWRANAEGQYSMRDRPLSIVANSVYYGKLYKLIYYVSDCVQTVLPFGVLAYLVSHRKNIKYSCMGPIIYIIGVAVLYLFWENKSEYFLVSFLLMIPFSSLGWEHIANCLHPKLALAFRKLRDKS